MQFCSHSTGRRRCAWSAAALLATTALWLPAPARSLAEGNSSAESVSTRALSELSEAFRRTARDVQPAVVSIRTVGEKVVLDMSSPELKDSDIGRQLLEQLQKEGVDPDDFRHEFYAPGGIGSGMIVDAAKGLILTNFHVIEGASQIDVELNDGRHFGAEIVNADQVSDMAILQIEDVHDLTQVRFADTRSIQIGDFVLAFGAPLEYEQTITHGIVSAIGRSARRELPLPYQNFIQTDASINRGNSGGPLVNLSGEVIGMNTAIASETGYDVGIGFAIPSSRITALLSRLISGEPIVRGYLGIRMFDVRDGRNEAIALGWMEPMGIIVSEVGSNLPAARAGVQANDIVYEIDGAPVVRGGDLQDVIALTEPGRTVMFSVFRDGQRIRLPVKVGRQPDNFVELSQRGFDNRGERADEEDGEPLRIDRMLDENEYADSGKARLGVAIRPLNERLRTRYGWGPDEDGYVIVDVEQASMASRRGLKPGDIIKKVNGKPLERGERLPELVQEQLNDKGLRLLVKSKRQGLRELLFRGEGDGSPGRHPNS